MKNTRRKFSSAFKTKVVLESLKEQSTLSELGQKHGINPTQIRTWKKEFLNKAESVFEAPDRSHEKALEQEKETLYGQIGRLKVENDWFKKKLES